MTEIKLEHGRAGMPVAYIDGKEVSPVEGLRASLEETCLTQAGLAMLLGKSPRTVAKYFLSSGATAIPAEALIVMKLELDDFHAALDAEEAEG